jgi:hypothetical protein
MGNFSWKCKGCGEELIEGELVRMNGSVGTYSGYGQAGDYEYHGCCQPAAWHEFCYQRTPKAKRNDKASESAPNQGLGLRHLEFMPNYDPEAPVKFMASVEICEGPGVVHGEYGYDQETRCPITKVAAHYPLIYITPDGPRDDADFRRRERESFDKLSEKKATEAEWQDHDDDFAWEKSPHNRATRFDTLAEALAAARTVTSGKCSEFVITIVGTQVGREGHHVQGQVYREERLAERTSRGGEKTGKYKQAKWKWSRR